MYEQVYVYFGLNLRPLDLIGINQCLRDCMPSHIVFICYVYASGLSEN